MKLRYIFTVTVIIVTVSLVILCGAKTAAAASLSLVADKLDNVRGLSFSPDGSLYVTESGVDGKNCRPSATSAQTLCLGNTAAITRIKDGKQERILSGLPSLSLTTKNEGAGPQDLKFDASGNAYLLYGYAGNPAERDTTLNSPGLGRLYRISLNTGALGEIADIAGYELANNPDQGAGAEPESAVVSHPIALAIKDDKAYMVDSGGNSFYTVGLNGSNLKGIGLPTQTVENPEYPPPDPSQPLPPGALSPGSGQMQSVKLQSVPTGVAIGPDGAAYISEFSGFPFPEGGARILRIGADGQPTVFAKGFTQLTDLEFDQSGNLFALQFADQAGWKGNLQGSLIKISPDGNRTTVVGAGEGLEAATALTVGPDGAVYVTNRGAGAGIGQVLKVEAKAVPEPSFMLGAFTFGVFAGGFKLKQKRSTVESM